jgi:hypothetical protein
MEAPRVELWVRSAKWSSRPGLEPIPSSLRVFSIAISHVFLPMLARCSAYLSKSMAARIYL